MLLSVAAYAEDSIIVTMDTMTIDSSLIVIDTVIMDTVVEEAQKPSKEKKMPMLTIIGLWDNASKNSSKKQSKCIPIRGATLASRTIV